LPERPARSKNTLPKIVDKDVTEISQQSEDKNRDVSVSSQISKPKKLDSKSIVDNIHKLEEAINALKNLPIEKSNSDESMKQIQPIVLELSDNLKSTTNHSTGNTDLPRGMGFKTFQSPELKLNLDDNFEKPSDNINSIQPDETTPLVGSPAVINQSKSLKCDPVIDSGEQKTNEEAKKLKVGVRLKVTAKKDSIGNNFNTKTYF